MVWPQQRYSWRLKESRQNKRSIQTDRQTETDRRTDRIRRYELDGRDKKSYQRGETECGQDGPGKKGTGYGWTDERAQEDS